MQIGTLRWRIYFIDNQFSWTLFINKRKNGVQYLDYGKADTEAEAQSAVQDALRRLVS